MHLIADGIVEREGVPGLARHLGYSERQVRRQLLADLGAGPLALARAQRAHVARLLLETTDLPVTEVAFAAGFGSLRQFNATIREVFATAPDRAAPGTPPRADARAAGRPPARPARAVRLGRPPGLPGRARRARASRRSSTASTGAASGSPTDPPSSSSPTTARPSAARLALADPRDLGPAVARCRRLLDLDADPVAVADVLGRDPLLVRAGARRAGPAVARRRRRRRARRPGGAGTGDHGRRCANPGRPGCVDAHGTPLAAPSGGLTHLFPAASDLAAADPASLPVPGHAGATRSTRSPTPSPRGDLDLDAGANRAEAARRLHAIRGIGPWTVGYIAMRALADPDALLPRRRRRPPRRRPPRRAR